MSCRRSFGSSMLATTAIFTSIATNTSHVFAQTSATGLEQIVVTARKQQENLLETPVTVNAFSAQQIDALQLREFKNIADYTPGININSGLNFNGRAGANIIIRGMTPSISQNASVFIDGSPVSAGYLSGIDDVERIEVLKGPQTAYFGRSTFAGAINIVTKVPRSDAFHGRADLTVGSRALVEGKASVEGPLIANILSARLTFRGYSTHGSYRNVADGTRFGDQSTTASSLAVHYTPSDPLTVNVYAMWQKDDDGPNTYGKIANVNTCNAGAAPAGQVNYICGVIPSTGPIPYGANPVTPQFTSWVLNNSTGFFNPIFKDQFLYHAGYARKVLHLHGTIDYDFDFGRLSSLSAYNKNDITTIADLDLEDSSGIPNALYGNPAFPFAPPFQNILIRSEQFFHDWSQELRLTSRQQQRFRWMFGLSYSEVRTANLVAGQSSAGFLVGGLGAETFARTPAVFGSASFDVFEGLTATFEGRYQVDNVRSFRRAQYEQIGSLIAGATFKNFTPRAILEYRFDQEKMIYASFSRGVNPGTFNTSQLAFPQSVQDQLFAATGAGPVVQPEKISNYEAGFKGQFLENRAQITLAAYHAIWTNQIVAQTFVANGGAINIAVNTNVGKTTLNGFEVEGDFRPIPPLTIGGNFGYAPSRIDNYVCVQCSAFTGSTNVNGHSLFRYSKINYSAHAQYTSAFVGDFEWYARVDYTYRGPQFADETNLARDKPSKQTAFRAGVQNDRMRFEGFVTNAFNDKGPTSVGRGNDPLRGNAIYFQLGVPNLRQFGVRATYNF